MQVFINIVRWVIIFLLQVLLFNHLQCYGLCAPQLYVLCLLMLPPLKHREWEMVIGLAVGLLMDIMSNSMGIHIAACVLVMFLRQPILSSMVQNIERVSAEVSMRTINEVAYIKYVLMLVFAHQVVVSLLSAFTFAHFGWTIVQILFSGLITCVLILGYNFLRR